MEELIELLEGKLGVHGLTLVFFIKQVHLQVNETFPVLLDQGVGRGDCEFEIEID